LYFPQGLEDSVFETFITRIFRRRVGFRVLYQVAQAAPGTLDLLDARVMQNGIELCGQFAVDLGDESTLIVATTSSETTVVSRSALLREVCHRALYFGAREIVFGLEFFLQQLAKAADSGGGGGCARGLRLRHDFGHG